MAGGVFRRPFHQIPRKRVFFLGAPVPVQIPSFPRNPALLRSIVLRPPRIKRRVTAPPLLGVRQLGVIIPVARMLQERFRKMMRARPREPFVPFIPVPAAVGAVPPHVKIPVRLLPVMVAKPRARTIPTFPAAVSPIPFPSRPPVRPERVAIRAIPPRVIPTFPAAVGSIPHPPRPAVRPLPVAARAQPPKSVPTFPATAGPTPFPVRPSVQKPRPVAARARPPTVPTFPAVVGPTPFLPKVAVRPTRILARVRPIQVPGGPAAPGRFTPFVRQQITRAVQLFRSPRVRPGSPTAPAANFTIVCSSGVWSVEVTFAACDNYRMELTGPAANNMDAAVAIEFVDPSA